MSVTATQELPSAEIVATCYDCSWVWEGTGVVRLTAVVTGVETVYYGSGLTDTIDEFSHYEVMLPIPVAERHLAHRIKVRGETHNGVFGFPCLEYRYAHVHWKSSPDKRGSHFAIRAIKAEVPNG